MLKEEQMGSNDISIEQEKAEDVVVLTVAGFVDSSTFEQLETCIFDSFRKGSYKILINLAQVQYLSSAGAGVFLNARGEAQENNGNVVLLSPSEPVRDVFELLGLTRVMLMTESRERALATF